MNGFYQFTTKIKDTLKLDPFVNTVTYGDIFQVDLSKQTIFPLSHLVVNNVTKESNVMRFNISILAMDIVDMTKDETTDIFIGNDNTQDIWHTQLKVLDRLTELLRRGSIVSEGYQLDGNPTFEQFTERFENYLAGWTVTFDVLVGNDMTICEVGSSGGTCSPAGYLIKDSAGTTLYNGTIASGEVGTITVGNSSVQNSDSTYSADIVAEGSLTLPDITIDVVNTASTIVDTQIVPSVQDATVTAPDAHINIKKTGDGTIASVDIPSGTSTNYSVADNAITVNGANGFSIDATDPLNIVLTDGTSSVTPTSVTYSQGQHKVDIVLPSSGIAIDTDAQAFLTATGITDATITSAINDMVVCLKTASLWTKMHAIYPFVGGTATTHKYNLKNPVDSDSAFRLLFSGGWTHSSLGATPNGTNGYANTFLTESTFMTTNSNGLGFYLGTNNSATTSDPVDMGAYVGATQSSLIAAKNDYNARVNGSAIVIAQATRIGFYSAQRTSATLTTNYKDGLSVASGNSGGTLPNIPLYLGNISFLTNTPYSNGYTNNRFQFAFVSDGLTQAENIYLETIVHLFQTKLSR